MILQSVRSLEPFLPNQPILPLGLLSTVRRPNLGSTETLLQGPLRPIRPSPLLPFAFIKGTTAPIASDLITGEITPRSHLSFFPVVSYKDCFPRFKKHWVTMGESPCWASYINSPPYHVPALRTSLPDSPVSAYGYPFISSPSPLSAHVKRRYSHEQGNAMARTPTKSHKRAISHIPRKYADEMGSVSPEVRATSVSNKGQRCVCPTRDMLI